MCVVLILCVIMCVKMMIALYTAAVVLIFNAKKIRVLLLKYSKTRDKFVLDIIANRGAYKFMNLPY